MNFEMQCIKKFAISSLIFYIRERVGWIPKVGNLTKSLAVQYGWVFGLSVTEMKIVYGAFRKLNPNGKQILIFLNAWQRYPNSL